MIRRWVAAVGGVAALVAAAASAAPAAAAPDAVQPGGWSRFHATSFVSPAGALCRFELRSDVLFDQEWVRTTQTFPDGTPRVQEFVGPLVVRLTDDATARSIVRDLSARAVVVHFADGSFDFQLHGPAAVGFHPGDGRPPGYYVLRGEHVVHFAADGTRTVTKADGAEENVCTTLSGTAADTQPA